MDILERAKLQFSNMEIRKIEVPEWKDDGGNPTIIYGAPFTLEERKSLMKFSKGDDIEFLVRLVIMKALDENQKPIFTIADRKALLNAVDPQVITRLANELSAAIDVDDMMGN